MGKVQVVMIAVALAGIFLIPLIFKLIGKGVGGVMKVVLWWVKAFMILGFVLILAAVIYLGKATPAEAEEMTKEYVKPFANVLTYYVIPFCYKAFQKLLQFLVSVGKTIGDVFKAIAAQIPAQP